MVSVKICLFCFIIVLVLTKPGNASARQIFDGINESDLLDSLMYERDLWDTTTSSFGIGFPAAKQWPESKVGRKQNKIIDMLWKKSRNNSLFVKPIHSPTTTISRNNVNLYVEPIHMAVTISANMHNDKTFNLKKYIFTVPIERTGYKSTTSSYIEFYYLDDFVQHPKVYAKFLDKKNTKRENPLIRNDESVFSQGNAHNTYHSDHREINLANKFEHNSVHIRNLGIHGNPISLKDKLSTLHIVSKYSPVSTNNTAHSQNNAYKGGPFANDIQNQKSRKTILNQGNRYILRSPDLPFDIDEPKIGVQQMTMNTLFFARNDVDRPDTQTDIPVYPLNVLPLSESTEIYDMTPFPVQFTTNALNSIKTNAPTSVSMTTQPNVVPIIKNIRVNLPKTLSKILKLTDSTTASSKTEGSTSKKHKTKFSTTKVNTIKSTTINLASKAKSRKKKTSTTRLTLASTQSEQTKRSRKKKKTLTTKALSFIQDQTKSTAIESSEPSTTSSVLDTSNTIVTKEDLPETLENRKMPYDKIKFFEVYDSRTTPWIQHDVKSTAKNINDESETIDDEPTVTIDHNLSLKKNAEKLQNTTELNPSTQIENSTEEVKQSNVSVNMNEIVSKLHEKGKKFDYITKVASWAEHPYLAAYFYDRFKIHCDAVVFSSHWLLASAACLSHRSDDPPEPVDRSPYVTYCSDSWWEPERIAYVKNTFVHPKYNEKDVEKRHLYNIGVIQVVSAMSTDCSGYASATILSHDFEADPGGSIGVAVGWGLDRYTSSYLSAELPKKQLSVMESLAFSNTCPGNSLYSAIKNKESLKNIICLLLPPYKGEDNDPTHGGILFVKGKLVGLYLQEERRSRGPQSAEYTVVWRLLPWVLSVAREPDEISFFSENMR